MSDAVNHELGGLDRLLAALRGKDKAATEGPEPTELDQLHLAVRRRRLGDPMADATDSYMSGTSSMEEAALALAADIPGLRRAALAVVPAAVARERAGLRSRCEVDPALTVQDRLAAYPPGAPLPADLAADLREIVGQARILLTADDDELIRRRQCLAVLLTLGDNTGDRLRNRAWARDEQAGWCIAADVGELSRRTGLRPEMADDYMGLEDHFGRLADAGQIELTLGWVNAVTHRPARVVTFAAIAAAVERCR